MVGYVGSKQQRLEPFVYFATEVDLSNTKFFCSNKAGTISYGVTFRVETVLNELTGALTQEKEEASVCRLEALTGLATIYQFEDRLTVTDCRSAVDCYLLDEKVLVVICHNRQTSQLYQLVCYLCGLAKKAIITHTKTKPLLDVTYNVVIGLGLLHKGQVAVIGSRGPFDGDREVVALLIAANPLKETTYPDVNMTKKIADFRQYLKKYNQSYDIFQRGVFFDHDGIYFLIKKKQLNQLVTKYLGKLIYKQDGHCDYELLESTHRMEFDGGLTTNHLMFAIQSGKNLWMAMDPPNFAEMSKISWRFHYWWLPKLLWLMIKGIELSVFLQRWDGGWCLHRYVGVLLWCFGPCLMPKLEADPVFHLYHLDLERNILRRAEASPPLARSIFTPYFDVAADVDFTGGLTLCELSQTEQSIKINYYHCPMRPPTLARLATLRAYRLFPAFEKSPMVRRMLGQTEFINH